MYEGRVKRDLLGYANAVKIPTVEVWVEFELIPDSLWTTIQYGDWNAICAYNSDTKKMRFLATRNLAFHATDKQLVAVFAHEYAHFLRRDPELISAHLDAGTAYAVDTQQMEIDTDALAATWVGPRLMADMLFWIHKAGSGSPRTLQRAQIMDAKAKELGL